MCRYDRSHGYNSANVRELWSNAKFYAHSFVNHTKTNRILFWFIESRKNDIKVYMFLFCLFLFLNGTLCVSKSRVGFHLSNKYLWIILPVWITWCEITTVSSDELWSYANSYWKIKFKNRIGPGLDVYLSSSGFIHD